MVNGREFTKVKLRPPLWQNFEFYAAYIADLVRSNFIHKEQQYVSSSRMRR